MKPKINKVIKKGHSLFLAYDQGLEHGPTDFNDLNVDPRYIIEIAKKAKYNAIIFQKGISEKYIKEIKESKIPLIIKLNGKTNLVKGEPVSRQICSVEEAKKLGAVGVGYTIYIGSEHESEMMNEFGKIQEETLKEGLFTVLWVYPRGKSVKGKSKRELMAYAARVGLELGADILKIRYEGKVEDLKWAIKSAGKSKVMIAGGTKKRIDKFLEDVRDIKNAGALGLAVGRNVWQSKNPLEVSKKIKEVLF